MLGKLAWVSGGWQLKVRYETAEMIIKGDLDRMAEDIGHAGKSRVQTRTGQRMTFSYGSAQMFIVALMSRVFTAGFLVKSLKYPRGEFSHPAELIFFFYWFNFYTDRNLPLIL